MLLNTLFHFGSIQVYWGLLIKLELLSLYCLLCWIALSWKFGFFCLSFTLMHSHRITYIHSTQCAQLPSKLRMQSGCPEPYGGILCPHTFQQWWDLFIIWTETLFHCPHPLGPEAPHQEIKRSWLYFLYFSQPQWFVIFIFDSAWCQIFTAERGRAN